MMKLDANCPEMSEVNRRVSYDPETGRFTALVSAGRRKVGEQLGYPDGSGYIKLAFNGKWVMAHRLAWRLSHGAWPTGEIDHINGNPSDNRIANLREATRSQNVMNTRRGNGVCWHKGRKKWQVAVKAKGKAHYLGCFADREAAEAVAAEAIRRLHGEFANIAPKPEAPKQEQLL
jgi:hypothetical protein